MTQKRIIFYRIGAIGDIIHTLPTLKLAKARNPDASVEIVVGSQQVADLIRSACDFVDRAWTIDAKNAFNKVLANNFSDEEQALKKSLQEKSADEFVYLHSNFTKALILNLRFFHASKLKVYKRDDELSAVANYALSYDSSLRDDLLSSPYAVLDYKVLQIRQLYSEQKYICIVPGVGKLRPHRAYPISKWMRLVEAVLSGTDYYIKILGGPDEMQLSRELDKQLASKYSRSKRIENFIGKTSLLQLAKIISQSEHVYSADTGILHIAAALGVNVSAVFSITSEQRFGPFTPSATIYRSPTCTCARSSTNVPKHCSNLINGYSACMWNVELAA